MSLPESLAQVHSSMSTEVRLIKTFAEEFYQALLTRMPPALPPDFTADDMADLVKIRDATSQVLESKGRKRFPVSLTVETNSPRVADFLMKTAGVIKHRSYLPEMTLSFLASHMEAFVKDYVLQVLVHDTRMLRSSATIPLDELAKHRSLKSVWRSVAEREVEALGYGSVDDIASYFAKRFQIDLTAFEKWGEVREISYRRNLIIHNRGRINSIYRRKVNYRGSTARLETTIPYVSAAADTYVEFFDFIHSAMSARNER